MLLMLINGEEFYEPFYEKELQKIKLKKLIERKLDKLYFK